MQRLLSVMAVASSSAVGLIAVIHASMIASADGLL